MKYDKTRPGLRQIQSGSCCGQFRQTDAQIIISFETFLWASASSGTFFSDHRQGYKKPHVSAGIGIMAVRTGIEPVISSVTGRHVNRYTNAP